jgi:hypothetical protein
MRDSHEIMITVTVPKNWSKVKANELMAVNKKRLVAKIKRTLKDDILQAIGVKFKIRVCEYGN